MNVVSQSSIVKFLAENMRHLGRSGDKALVQLNISKKIVYQVPAVAKTLDGFLLMDKHKVEALAVTDNSGKLIGELSAANLRGLGADIFTRMELSVEEFIKGHRLPETCQPAARLKDVITQLARTGSHRLWVVDAEAKPIGIVSLTDVMKALMLCLNVTPRRKKTRSVDFSKLKLKPINPTGSP